MDISLLADHQQEANVIARWYLAEWGHNMPETHRLILTEKILLGINRDNFPITILAHIEGNLVGVAELKYRELEQYPNWHHWLDGVYVPLEHRGEGISSKLIIEAISRTNDMGITWLYLRCESHNIALYEKFGFVSLMKEKGKGVTKTVMGLNMQSGCEA